MNHFNPLPTANRTAITCAPLVFAFSTSAFFDSATKSRNGLRGAIDKVVFEFMTEVYFFGLNLSLRQLTKTS